MSWTTIESDPGVFTELLSKFGAEGLQVEELYSLDEASLAQFARVHGLVFLFKYTREAAGRRDESEFDAEAPVWFSSQVVNNACATQALVHILMNRASELSLGPVLTEFLEFTTPLPPEFRGAALNDSAPIRTAHNEFARPEPFIPEERAATDDDDVYHFVAYVPCADGVVYELDGMQRAPIPLGTPSEGGSWTTVAAPEIQRRMTEYSGSEIRFNLLAVVDSPVATGEDRMTKLDAALRVVSGDAMDGDLSLARTLPELGEGWGAPSTADDASMAAMRLGGLREEAERQVAEGRSKLEAWKTENARRRHNWIPFIVEMAKGMAEAGVLDDAYQAGKEKAREARRKAMERKKTGAV